jgi:dihydroorotase-like cyclic amidohydrolase
MNAAVLITGATAADGRRLDIKAQDGGGVIPGNRSQLAGLAERGVIGFKAFMSTTGTDDFPRADDVTLLEAMSTIAPLRLPLLLHAGSDAIINELTRRAHRIEETVAHAVRSESATARRHNVVVLAPLAAT